MSMKKINSSSTLGKLVMKTLFLIGAFCMVFFMHPALSYAGGLDNALTSSQDAGEEEERTNIREPGSSEDADELGELNIANNVTVRIFGGTDMQLGRTDMIRVRA